MQTAGSTPTATIIIPTFNRASTLPYSIQSALDQSIHNIEVFVVGDGCTDACRNICQDFAARDNRFIFLDFPKAPFAGAASRDAAVRQSRSDFIFYNDDDDLLLPHHVETLLEGLKNSDIVDTPAVSVALDGHVDLALHDSADPLQRSLLETGQLKMVFDTHFAHTKKSYLMADSPWIVQDPHVALSMLTAFARSPATWATLQRITALSFHGMRRVTMSDADRASELAQWSQKMRSADLERSVRAEGSYIYHSHNLAAAFFKAGRTHDEIVSWLKNLFHLAAKANGSKQQESEIEATVRFATRQDISHEEAAGIFRTLLKAGLGPQFLSLKTINDLKRYLSVGKLLPNFPGQDAISVWARIALLMPDSIRDPALRSAAERAFLHAPSALKYNFAVIVAHAAYEAGETNIAWNWSERAALLAPASHLAASLWSLRMKLALKLGYAQKFAIARTRLAEAKASR